MIYVKLGQVLCGTIEASKVWHETFSSNLIRLGFRANAHDQCIFNKMVKNIQITILIYVDDVMIACTDQWCDIGFEYRVC